MNNQAAQVGRGVGAGAELGSKMISSGTMRTTLNNPVVDAGMNMANGMDADLAKTVASTTNAKIKAKKAKKEEKTKAIESTAQTALAVTALVVTGGAAAPALGSVLTGTAGGTFYAVQGAVAGVVNGTLQSLAATNLGALTKGSKELVGKAKEVQQIALDNPILIKALAATNVSYTKEDGWGIKANVTGVVNALGADKSLLNKIANSFNSVTIGQSQRGGATVNLGISTGSGTLGLNYTGNSGKWDGSFDVIERQAGTGNLSAELNYGEDGFSVSGNADLGNGLGFGLESGRNGTTGSLTILGSQQGTVDEDGNYEANGNFLGEISGQDIIDLNNTRQQQREAEENERNPAKTAKDAADAKDARDDDAKEVGGEEGPSGLVDLAFAGLGVVMSAGAAFLAGGGSSSASQSGSAGGQSGAGNESNASTVARKPEDENEIDSKKKKEAKGDDPQDGKNKKDVSSETKNNQSNIAGDIGNLGFGMLVAIDTTKPNDAKDSPTKPRQADNSELVQGESQKIDMKTIKTVDALIEKLRKADPSLSDDEIKKIKKTLSSQKGYENGKIPIGTESFTYSRNEKGKLKEVNIHNPLSENLRKALAQQPDLGDVSKKTPKEMEGAFQKLFSDPKLTPGDKSDIIDKVMKFSKDKVTHPTESEITTKFSSILKDKANEVKAIISASNGKLNESDIKKGFEAILKKEGYAKKAWVTNNDGTVSPYHGINLTEDEKKRHAEDFYKNNEGVTWNDGFAIRTKMKMSGEYEIKSNDLGLMQVNDLANKEIDPYKLATDWEYNVSEGSKILLNRMEEVVNKWNTVAIKDKEGNIIKMPPMNTENILRATYALYNGGNITNIVRPWNPNAPGDKIEIDKKFNEILQGIK